ncbi:imidazole glycerol phosphate synthase subunit HisH [Aliidongia dinghuensis]|uniref:Imidazole glycerol phosphate synthase subunit HisH n=1 Tax=Aliidongia dinghuensis TaxID=1867774 RepID=A0A8J2YYE1_9PROT|nr:imidazole glycerol phosphate synthase subunit HisH [Aliidongia dinghuensis]GGF32785.1 imidazole glycerol phosphate synthase subunit HisH [Aliidongia dinghuensis]
MQRCVIIDYGSGNLRSAAKAFERAAAEAGLDIAIEVSADAAALAHADRIVLPGVGAFADCRRGLDAVEGLVDALQQRVIRDAVPFIGICVGMQLVAERGLEFQTSRGLGWLAGDVVAIPPAPGLKIPHMGWNDLRILADHPVLDGIKTGDHTYFVHSFKFAAAASDILATVEYGGPVAAVVGRDNMVGTQFHPEKSQAVGLKLIGNFLKWRP